MRRSLRRSLRRTWKVLSDAVFAVLLFAAAAGLVWIFAQALTYRTVADPGASPASQTR